MIFVRLTAKEGTVVGSRRNYEGKTQRGFGAQIVPRVDRAHNYGAVGFRSCRGIAKVQLGEKFARASFRGTYSENLPTKGER